MANLTYRDPCPACRLGRVVQVHSHEPFQCPRCKARFNPDGTPYDPDPIAEGEHRYELSLAQVWDARDPVDAVRTFLEQDGGPCWQALTWTVRDLETGKVYEVTLDDGVVQNRVLETGGEAPAAG
jgi:hypothetical protein